MLRSRSIDKQMVAILDEPARMTCPVLLGHTYCVSEHIIEVVPETQRCDLLSYGSGQVDGVENPVT